MAINPLVSVVIITYNSTSTIVDVMDSVKNQSYKNTEIVISDDCSTDNTVEVCTRWTQDNPQQRVQIVTTKQNTGVAGNLNRGLKAAKGEWIKIMAGDDMLFDYSIQCFLDYVTRHNTEVCVSMLSFFGSNRENMIIKKFYYNDFFNKYNKLNKANKYRLLLKECVMPMPGLFISKRLFAEIGYINERYPFAEEWPTYLTLLKNGYDIPYFQQELVRYRCEGNTLGSDGNNRLSLRVFKDTIKSFKEYRRPLMIDNRMYLQAWSQTLQMRISLMKYKSNLSILDKFVIFVFRVIDPFIYPKVIQKIFYRYRQGKLSS